MGGAGRSHGRRGGLAVIDTPSTAPDESLHTTSTYGAAAWVTLAARVLVGGYFVYSGWVKLQAPIEFLKQLRMYEMLPESMPWIMNSVAVVLPWLEMFCGCAMVLGGLKRGAALLVALMLCVFTPAIVIRSLVIMRETGTAFFDLAFDCGCGAGVVVIWKKLLLNLSLMAGGLVVLFSRSNALSVAALRSRRVT